MDILMEDRIQRCKSELINVLVSHGIEEEVASSLVTEHVERLVNNGCLGRSLGFFTIAIKDKHINRQAFIAALNDIIKRYSLNYYESAKLALADTENKIIDFNESTLTPDQEKYCDDVLEYYKSKCPIQDLTQEDIELYTILVEGSVPWDNPSAGKISAEDCKQFSYYASLIGMGKADIESYIDAASTGSISRAVQRIIKTQEEINARYRLNQSKLSDSAVKTNRWDR